MVQEVAILFENYLWRGNRATKRSADNFNAFKSYNYPELAKIGLDLHYNIDALHRADMRKKLKVNYGLDTRVMFIDLHPGMTEDILRHQLSAPGIKGIVMKTYGAGNAPTASWFAREIKEAVDRGVVIVAVTQCANGGVSPGLYEAGRQLSQAGVISGYDLTSEAALTKLMHLFGQGYDKEMVKEHMLRSLCGEVTIKH